MAGKIPNINDARQQYAVNRYDSTEGIRQPLYDYQLYPTAGATQFNFFQQPQGQGLSSHPGNAGNVKTIADTNMEAAGQLPNPKSFLLEGIEVVFEPGSVATANTFTPVSTVAFAAVAAATVGQHIADSNALRVSGELQLFIGSKAYVDMAPLGAFPPSMHGNTNASVASNSATTGELISGMHIWAGRPYALDPMFLPPTQNFKITLNFPVAVATPSGFNGRIGVILRGILYRNSQ